MFDDIKNTLSVIQTEIDIISDMLRNIQAELDKIYRKCNKNGGDDKVDNRRN